MPEEQQAPVSDVVSVNQDNLDDFNSKALGLPTAAEQLAASEAEVIESGPNESEEVIDAEPEKLEAKEEKPKKKNSFQERISELTAKEKAAQALADKERGEKEQLRRELDELKKAANPSPEPVIAADDGKPKQEDFKEWGDYVEALSDWKVDQKFKAREQQQATEAARQAWQNRVNETKTDLPDYDAVMAAHGDMVLPHAVLAAIEESEVGPRIAHHLAANPEIAEALGKLTITAQVKQIGKIEASLTKAPDSKVENPPIQVSKAPAPVTPIKGTTTYESKLDADGNFHGTPEEWAALRRAGKIK